MQCINCNAECGAEDFCSAKCQISFDRAEAREREAELERRAYAEHVRPGADGDELSAAIRQAEEACQQARERVAAEERERGSRGARA